MEAAMPQLNPAFFPTQLFWLAVCFTVFFLLMWRLALPRVATIMQQRQERIAGDLDRAAQLKRDAEEVVAAYEASLAEARAKAQALYRETSDAIAAVAAKQQAEAGQAITARIAEAEKRIGAARSEAMAQLKTVAGEVAAAAVAKVAGVTPDQSRLAGAIDSAIGERR
jgi:F-type H+-transporting ATPase subunit b